MWDAVIVTTGLLTVQLWGEMQMHSLVLLARVAGSALGTWLTIEGRQGRGSRG